MKKHYPVCRLFCIMAVLAVCLPSGASRIPISFDQALESAELVVQGDVVELWNPFEPSEEGNGRRLGHSNCYRMKVGKCFKGTLKPGAEVVFWDRHAGSTASYGIWMRGEYIVYLSPADLSNYEATILNPEGGAFYRPVRVRNNREATADSFERELRLLDLFAVHPPADKRTAYRQLLEDGADPVFLACIVKDWPRPLTPQDVALFKDKVLAGDGKDLHVRRMLGELMKYPESMTNADVALLLEKGGAAYFESLNPLITEQNISDFREQLCEFLHTAGPAGPYRQLIETLSALDPDYFKERLLVSHDFPIWKLLPCLKALGLNGSDLGMADFPESMFSVTHNRLLEISKIKEGDLFWISFPLRYPSNCDDMRSALPLLEPILTGRDSPVRRACVALFRTYGVPLRRIDGAYVPQYTDAPASCPVKLELRMDRSTFTLGEEIRFTLTETAMVDGGDFCFEGNPLTTLHFEGSWNSPEFLDQHIWDNVTKQRDSYINLEKGMFRKQSLKLFRKIDRPGTYRITFAKCYMHDGSEHGLDAWTGMAFAENELVFEVEEP